VIGKLPARLAGAWLNSTFRAYTVTLIETMSWSVALALILMLVRSLTQGAQLVLLIPLMQLIGLNVQEGSVGWLAQLVSSAFGVAGVSPTPATVLGSFLLLTVVLALITRWQSTFNFKLQQDFLASLRRRLYQTIVKTNWLSLSRSRSSDFTHALTTELDRVGVATSFLLQLLTSIILMPIYVVLALYISVEMTVLVFVSGGALLLLLRKRTQAARSIGEENSVATSDLYSAAIEHLGGLKTVKSYGAEERNADIFSKLTGRVTQTYINGNRNYAATAFRFTVGSAIILSAILFVSLELFSIPAGSLLLLLLLFNRMIPIFNSIQQNYQFYLSALPAFARVMEMQASCEAAAESLSRSSEEIELQRELRLEHVCFGYEEGQEDASIRELDLVIQAGKTTAIVGPSGAGKSTVADLVMGLISPDRGRVLVDDIPLEAERMRSWRHSIGYVTQDTFLFHDTVRANLLWACPEASDEEIIFALELAAGEFVFDLPDGIHTIIGDRGVRLSGGERQRLALARALLRNPSLLMLDEATSALDSENERRIQLAIEKLHGQMTILLITHRLSTIRGADVIHVLEKGRLVESGDWETLLNRADGRFRALCNAQDISGSAQANSSGTLPSNDGKASGGDGSPRARRPEPGRSPAGKA
jgi:ATP-binding cassette, subfamily C, bacterial